MRTEPIEEVYFNWLYDKVASVAVPTPSLTFYTLMQALHTTEFVWTIQGDDNRAEDGIELRRKFFRATFTEREEDWLHIPCSVFEMLIAFSDRCSFQTGRSERDWFWIFLEHLDLDQMSDARSSVTEIAYERLYNFVWRLYSPEGVGGLFPLRHPKKDQRKVEIWYQLFEYLDETES